jgi:hypothetical protein
VIKTFLKIVSFPPQKNENCWKWYFTTPLFDPWKSHLASCFYFIICSILVISDRYLKTSSYLCTYM